ncbi:lysophospholipase-like protein 1 [Anopheles ziemanni]|uniref:lysophospholipase-like protein 1 n=1 Tax=Anopheles coustani TaxID=139045 RepID=UPI002659566B|nr:lysophospholipase-like protein 1 [Anopheles coustani]XP_058172458.1 lysophospholipase-like protein 1 [Anopheles ziemanni]
MRLIEKVFKPTGPKHAGTLIFFHGSGDSGSGLTEWIRFLLGRDLEFPHIKVIIPTAPVQPYTPMGGENSNVWFNRKRIEMDCPEIRTSLASIYDTVNELLVREMATGTPLDRIVVGGFSMGGALAMHTGFHLNRDLAGVFAISSFLNTGSIVYESLGCVSQDEHLPELLMMHGERDDLVPLEWGQTTFDELAKLGVRGQFVPHRNALHEIKKDQLLRVIDWVQKLIPEPKYEASPPPAPKTDSTKSTKKGKL